MTDMAWEMAHLFVRKLVSVPISAQRKAEG